MILRKYPTFTDKENLQRDLQQLAFIRNDDNTVIQNLADKGTFYKGFFPNTREVSADTTFGNDDYNIDVNAVGGARTITLPAVSQALKNRIAVVSKNDASGNAVTISGNGANINGAATKALAAQYNTATMQFLPVAGEWRVI